MRKKRVIIYGLGSKWEKNRDFFEREFEIIGYSDRDKSAFTKLKNKSQFIEKEKIPNLDFDKIIICCGGDNAFKKSFLFELIKNGADKLFESDIIFCGELFRERIQAAEFLEEVDIYKELNKRESMKIKNDYLYPILDEIGESGGCVSHYFFQDIWGAKKVYRNNPQFHYDIGSLLPGFLAHLLVFRDNVTMIDIRPIPNEIEGISFICNDATEMKGFEDGSIESLSSLHAVEHFGLGRYGDPIDPDACFKAMKSFQRVIKPGGHIYFSVPSGNEEYVEFNAYRNFNPFTIIETFDKVKLVDFSFIKGDKVVTYAGDKVLECKDTILKEMGRHNCGMFDFVKE